MYFSMFQLKLVSPTSSRLEHLVSQMKWRLQEGEGEAIYQIGVEDNGMLAGLKEEDLKESLETLKTMADRFDSVYVFEENLRNIAMITNIKILY